MELQRWSYAHLGVFLFVLLGELFVKMEKNIVVFLGF
jgi:hypothetical protein